MASNGKIPRAHEVIGHCVHPITLLGNTCEVVIEQLVNTACRRQWSRGIRGHPPTASCVKLQTQFFKQKRVVFTILRAIRVATQTAAHRIFPVDIDTIEVVCSDEFNA